MMWAASTAHTRNLMQIHFDANSAVETEEEAEKENTRGG
jgi:hypothetical protein